MKIREVWNSEGKKIENFKDSEVVKWSYMAERSRRKKIYVNVYWNR